MSASIMAELWILLHIAVISNDLSREQAYSRVISILRFLLNGNNAIAKFCFCQY